MTKARYKLEQQGLCIYFYEWDQLRVEFQACTHGGWAAYKVLRDGSLEAEPYDNPDSKSEIKDWARKYSQGSTLEEDL